MAVNEFLPFGLGAGANVLSQADWASDSERLVGFTRGIARSAKANTAWRQSSFVTAAIAQMIADRTGQDVRDNGDLAGFIRQFAAGVATLRDVQTMTGPTTFHVSTTGNDSTGDGRSPGTAWRTPQYAVNYLLEHIDANGFQMILKFADGTYTGIDVVGTMEGSGAGGGHPAEHLLFIGNEANPAACILEGSAPQGFYNNTIHAGDGANITVGGFTLRHPGGGCIYAEMASRIRFRNIIFGQCTESHIMAQLFSRVRAAGNYAISGGAQVHADCQGWGDYVCFGIGSAPVVININGNPNFSSAFARVSEFSTVSFAGDTQFIGPATGSRYFVEKFSMFETGGLATPGVGGTVNTATFGLVI